jgi:N6-L-threonylcarbamoyladenine synthase
MALMAGALLARRRMSGVVAELPGRAWTVLGIETSCDDTGVAIVQYPRQVAGPALPPAFLASQFHLHNPFGGVVPRYAARSHRAMLPEGLAAMQRSDAWSAVQAVAVTAGPGLALCLKEGYEAGAQVARALGVPLVHVHHVEAHLLSARLQAPEAVPYPFVALVASGGHTSLVLARGTGDYAVLGESMDDAAGETWDKVARMCLVGLHGTRAGAGADEGGGGAGTDGGGGPPRSISLDAVRVEGEKGVGAPQAAETVASTGHFGAALEALAAEGDDEAVPLPVPLRPRGGGRPPSGGLCDFSFSGLKGAARRWAEAHDMRERKNAADLAASFQRAACLHIADRVHFALQRVASLRPAHVVLAGGVAANRSVRRVVQDVCDRHAAALVCPPPQLCTDNGVMVAWAAIERLRANLPFRDNPHANYSARWPLGTPQPPAPSAP